MTTNTDARTTLIAALAHVAPDADPSAVPGDADLMEELDLDSIDLVTIVTWIHDNAGIDIPESDYAQLFSLDSFVGYLSERSAGAS